MQSLSCWTFFQGEGGGSSHCHWISGKYHQMIANNEKMVLLCFNIRLLSGWLVCFHPDTIAAGWALGNLSSVNMELMLFQREGQKKKKQTPAATETQTTESVTQIIKCAARIEDDVPDTTGVKTVPLQQKTRTCSAPNSLYTRSFLSDCTNTHYCWCYTHSPQSPTSTEFSRIEKKCKNPAPV